MNGLRWSCLADELGSPSSGSRRQLTADSTQSDPRISRRTLIGKPHRRWQAQFVFQLNLPLLAKSGRSEDQPWAVPKETADHCGSSHGKGLAHTDLVGKNEASLAITFAVFEE
jgi:hypothetical protein